MPFTKRAALLISAIFVVLTLASCGTGISANSPTGQSPSPDSESRVYYNGVYGLRVEVPQGWEVASLIPSNMTRSPEESDDSSDLESVSYEDSGSVIQMIELWSREDSSDMEHAGLMIYVELYEGIDEATYLSAFEAAYSGEFNGYNSVLVSRDTFLLEGLTFNLLKFRTTLPDSDDAYFEEYYVRKAAEGEFLVVCTNYWEGNEVSYNDSLLVLNSISFFDQ